MVDKWVRARNTAREFHWHNSVDNLLHCNILSTDPLIGARLCFWMVTVPLLLHQTDQSFSGKMRAEDHSVMHSISTHSGAKRDVVEGLNLPKDSFECIVGEEGFWWSFLQSQS